MSDPTKRDVRSEVSVEAHAALLAEAQREGIAQTHIEGHSP